MGALFGTSLLTIGAWIVGAVGLLASLLQLAESIKRLRYRGKFVFLIRREDAERRGVVGELFKWEQKVAKFYLGDLKGHTFIDQNGNVKSVVSALFNEYPKIAPAVPEGAPKPLVAAPLDKFLAESAVRDVAKNSGDFRVIDDLKSEKWVFDTNETEKLILFYRLESDSPFGKIETYHVKKGVLFVYKFSQTGGNKCVFHKIDERGLTDADLE